MPVLKYRPDESSSWQTVGTTVDGYTKEESLSAGTRTALSLPETATPDNALSEIVRQLSEPKGIQIVKLWENLSPTSNFEARTLQIDFSNYDLILGLFRFRTTMQWMASVTTCAESGYALYCTIASNRDSDNQPRNYTRRIEFSGTNEIIIRDGWIMDKDETSSDNSICIPCFLYGIRGIIA